MHVSTVKAFNVYFLWEIRCHVSILWSLLWVHVLILFSPRQCTPPLLVTLPLCACFVSGGKLLHSRNIEFLPWLHSSRFQTHILALIERVTNEWKHTEGSRNGYWKVLRRSVDEEQLLCYDKRLLNLGFLSISKLWGNMEYNERDRK